MADLLDKLLNFSASRNSYKPPKQYDASIKSYLSIITNLSSDDKHKILANHASVLEALDPAMNSIGCLTVLDILLNTNQSDSDINRRIVLDKAVDFLVHFDPIQIRYVAEPMLRLLNRTASGTLFTAFIAVQLLARAIMRIDPSGSMFTSTHLAMLKLAYDTDTMSSTEEVIDSDIAFFPHMAASKEAKCLCDDSLVPAAYISGLTDPIKPAMVLEYNLLRGLTYTSNRQWSKAQKAFEQVITHPTKDKAVSKIMSETHKKWILVGLLNEGKTPTLPSYTSAAARHSYGITSKLYVLVASLFSTDKAARLRSDIEENRSTWEEDGNATLIAEVVAAYQDWQIINLRRIYTQVSIGQVQNLTLSGETGKSLTDPREVYTLVERMIGFRMLNGVLEAGASAEDSYLTFREDSASMDEAGFTNELTICHKNVEALSKQYYMTNERLCGNKEYVRFAARERKNAEKDNLGPEDGFDSQIEDEDLMTGVLPHT